VKEPLTKSFDDLVQNCAANDPEFAAALLRETGDTPPLTMCEALREIWKAASYPIRGNEDWRIAARMDAEALERAGKAVPAPDGFRTSNAKTSCRRSTICSTLTGAEVPE
jgi:hypothetical protein